jgi:hypothetical protein
MSAAALTTASMMDGSPPDLPWLRSRAASRSPTACRQA